MKKDSEVEFYMQLRRKGVPQALAAKRAGMCERTARKYEKAQALPSQLKPPRTHRTRSNPFEQDWQWVVSQLERDPALQATTLFALLSEKHPQRYQPNQLHTLQRHIAAWRALSGPDKEVIFQQVHQPAQTAQSDFTHMAELGITVAGQPFEHLLYHLVLTYSNVEAVSICPSETFEALAEGLEAALWQIGGVPQQHRTDHLSAALRRLDKQGREDFTENYRALMNHYGMQPTTNNTGVAHENGDVEQSHFRFKEALDQALRVRGSRDFPSQKEYQRFLHELVQRRNLTRHKRFEEERPLLKPLPNKPLAPCRELKVSVSRFSTIQVLGNTYSVPFRLIGTTLKLKVRAQTLEAYLGTTHALSLPRLLGQHQKLINYRHVIWSLVQKPHAFALYRYREEFFPSLVFRKLYDTLAQTKPRQAEREYLRILHLAVATVWL
jgi:transposase